MFPVRNSLPLFSLSSPSSIRLASAPSPSPPLFNPSRSGSVAAKGGVAHLLPHHRSACQRTRRCLFSSSSLRPCGRRRSDSKVVKQESTASEPHLRRLEHLDAIKGTLHLIFLYVCFLGPFNLASCVFGKWCLQSGNVFLLKSLLAFHFFSSLSSSSSSSSTDKPNTCCDVTKGRVTSPRLQITLPQPTFWFVCAPSRILKV